MVRQRLYPAEIFSGADRQVAVHFFYQLRVNPIFRNVGEIVRDHPECAGGRAYPVAEEIALRLTEQFVYVQFFLIGDQLEVGEVLTLFMKFCRFCCLHLRPSTRNICGPNALRPSWKARSSIWCRR